MNIMNLNSYREINIIILMDDNLEYIDELIK
jgi:hypothetical protein